MRVAVVDGVASLVLIHRLKDLWVAQRVDAVPEQKMRAAKEKNPARRERGSNCTPQPPEPQHADQNEQARHGRDVMREKVWIEIGAEGKNQKRERDPGEPVFLR